MRNSPSPIRLLFILLTAGVVAAACGTPPAGVAPPMTTTAAAAPTGSAQPAPDSARPAPDSARPAPAGVGAPVRTTPVQLAAGGAAGQNEPQQLSTADYRMWAGQLYTQELTLIHQEQQTLANETAPPATRAAQITNQLLPQLQQLLAQVQSVQPVDAPAADLHQHLINALQLMIAAYQDLATGITQNDAAVLARGRSELATESQELGIWVHGVPNL